MPPADELLKMYEEDGFVILRQLLVPDRVAELRAEIDRYIREDLNSKPADARTLEADGTTVRNLWRLEQHHPRLCDRVFSEEIAVLVAPLVGGEPVLEAVETFNKPARVGSGVPPHQDNAYFCQTPPDMLTVWIALDPVTRENGPVFYIKGTHRQGVLPTKPSGVRGNSIGLARAPEALEEDRVPALLAPGDATIHHCNTVHYSGPNTTAQSRLALLLVYRGRHTQTDPALKQAYTAAAAAMPPA